MTSYPKSNLISALAIALMVIATISARLSTSSRTETKEISINTAIEVASPLVTLSTQTVSDENWRSVEIKPGDNLSIIFERSGFSPNTLHQIMSLGNDVKVLRKILPGNKLSLNTNEAGDLYGLRYERSPLEVVEITRLGAYFHANKLTFEPEILIAFRSGEISYGNPSLYESGKVAGLSDAILMELSYIFQWDISFALDLRQGDSYSLLFQEKYLDGQKVKDGEILAARFNNLGKTYTALLYTDVHGNKDYYTPDGRSLRKAFIRDPIHFSHVSSGFNLRRLHPIHDRVMPHRGIDYAANRGTPIVSAGDGRVKIARRNSASGKYIVIQHGEEYTTKYLHLSNFAKGIRPGKTVRQGETIGYVGSTGWATAPHLHYEFLLKGVQRNPRTVRLPMAKPIDHSEVARFKSHTSEYLEQLDSLSSTEAITQLGD